MRLKLGLLLLSIVLFDSPKFASNVAAQTPSNYKIVKFKGKAYSPSPLKKRIAKQKNLKSVEMPGDVLSAQLYRPQTGDKFPAIILVHDCRGIQPYQQQWAEQLKGWGYVVLLLDSFTTRKIESTCDGLAEKENFLIRGGRTQDIFAAYDYIKAQDYIEPFRIGLMGWDYHSVLGALANHGLQQEFDAPFMGAVAIYPSCNATIGTGSVSPLLILAAEQDDWTPAEQCRKMIEYSKEEMDKIKVKFLQAKHGFDDPTLQDETIFPTFRNYFKSPALGVTMQYDRTAHQQAIKLTRRFIDFNVKYRPIQITLDDLPAEFTQEEIEKATWINPPDQHGPDIPPQGYSLFDKIFSFSEDGKTQHDIPYPFDRILNKLSKLSDQPGTKQAKLKLTLFPAGRSLTRNASAPEFFKYPRIIVMLDSEAKISDGHYGPLLKDRLYIALTEPANVLEIISYNDTMQRFEFQVVHNYARNQQPSVVYAKRSLCLSCHQNHAPIFPNAPWDETNFNQQIFSKIKAVRDDFYGFTTAVPALSSTNDIDRSTNRATRLPIYNALWQKSCGNNDSPENAAKTCRAQIFKSMLQYRLSNKTGFDRGDQNYQDNFIGPASTAWQENWPDGLKIPRANITDRNPFVEKMVVSSKFDPLTSRDPETIWFGRNLRDVEQVIIGLSQQIHSHDIGRLDRVLSLHAAKNDDIAVYESDCTLTPSRTSHDRIQAKIQCTDRNRTEKNNFQLIGEIELGLDPKTAKGKFNSVRLDEDSVLYDLEFATTSFTESANKLLAGFEVTHKKSDLSVRTTNGSAVTRFELNISQDGFDHDNKPIKATLAFSVRDDFRAASNAVDSLVLANQGASKALFSNTPFNANSYMRSLLEALGENEIIKDCCDSLPSGLAKNTLPTSQFFVDENINVMTAPLPAVFTTLCSACHRTGLELPPSFLSGNQEQIQRNLVQCAPRIAYRLQMWKKAASLRAKSPMPPNPPLINKQKLSVEQWKNHALIDRITRYALVLIDSTLSEDELLTQVLNTPFENLQECRAL